MKKYILFSIVIVIVLICDQATKAVILSSMPVGESVPVIPGFFNIAHVRNPGAAFGFLAEAAPAFRYAFFVSISIIAVLLILYYVKNTEEQDRFVTLALSLILAGALGNLIDRLRFGEVIDFLDMYIGRHHWPAFNVADSSITVGAVLLIWQMLFKRKI